MTSRAEEFTRDWCETCGGEKHRYAGPSIVEMMERELDVMVREDLGNKIVGMATAIAIIRQPYSYLGMKPDAPFAEIVDNVLAASQARVREAARRHTV